MANPFPIPFAINGDRSGIPDGIQSSGKLSFSEGFGKDYQKQLEKDPNAKNIERSQLNQILYLITSKMNELQTAIENSGSEVGVPLAFPSWNIPAGYIPYDGRAFDKLSYPKLAQLFPNGYLPDLRGLVIRGVDANRGLDTGRGILTYQEDCIQNITGGVPADIGQSGFIGHPDGVWGVFYDNGPLTGGDHGYSAGEVRKYVFDASRVVRTGPEVRMKNIAFYYITKAG